jgi:hypothetical protein
MYGISIAELTDLDVAGTREDHDASDLGDKVVQHAGGRLNIMVTGNANYLTQATALLEAVFSSVDANINATGAIKVSDPKGSTALSGTGVWLDGGLTMPAGIMTQPFRFAVNTPSVP